MSSVPRALAPEAVLDHVGPHADLIVPLAVLVVQRRAGRLRARREVQPRRQDLAERARALTAISAPEHREALEREAHETGVLPRASAPPRRGGRTPHPSAPEG